MTSMLPVSICEQYWFGTKHLIEHNYDDSSLQSNEQNDDDSSLPGSYLSVVFNNETKNNHKNDKY
jgi:hypothetical protein